MIVIVPLGHSGKVVLAANELGAANAIVLRARGADSVKESIFSLRVEPEEEIILVTATEEVTSALSRRIRDEFEKSTKRSGSVYILPLQPIDGVTNIE